VEKTYWIVFQSFEIHLTKEQTLLLSTSAFQCNHQTGKSFEISNPPSHISEQEVLDCFNSLISLFNDTDQIEINDKNKAAFLFLSHQLDNPSLEKVCLKVNFYFSQYFTFSSKRFRQIPQNIFSAIFDFTIYTNSKAFHFNSAFAFCLYAKIFELNARIQTNKKFILMKSLLKIFYSL
jgi:hypothetical protein